MNVLYNVANQTKKTWDHLTSVDEKDKLKEKLEKASTYSEWEELAVKLDNCLGNDIWRENPVSRKYDYKLISRRLKDLEQARKNEDVDFLLENLRSGLLRNLGSIATTQLYNRAYSGTKLLIEDYINEVVQCLDYLEKKQPGMNLTLQQQLDFFHDTRQSFGNTVLILHGGSLFGLCHIGAVKSLFKHGLLPRILSGSTVGALVASLVCYCRDDELLDTLDTVSKEMPDMTKNIYSEMKYGSVAEGIISTLCPPEIAMFEQYIKDKIGDMTFEEAYLRSDRILNITVKPNFKKNTAAAAAEIPPLLNYLSAPHVVIWSAARASIGTGVLHKKIDILCKNKNGEIVKFIENNEDIEFIPSNQTVHVAERESPYTRLTELFNVNNFLISLARPYFAPLLLSEFKHRGYQSWRIRFLKLLRLEFQHRLVQSSQLHILPSIVRQWCVDENIPGGFQVTVVPELPSLVHDFGKVFDSHNIRDKVDYWVQIGEQSTWPMISIIWARCAIEFVLDDIYNRKRELRT